MDPVSFGGAALPLVLVGASRLPRRPRQSRSNSHLNSPPFQPFRTFAHFKRHSSPVKTKRGVLFMNTASRVAINRANARYSIGPKTESGKKVSSLNALRHGLTGQIVVMPNEDLGSLPAAPRSLRRRIPSSRRHRRGSGPSPGRRKPVESPLQPEPPQPAPLATVRTNSSATPRAPETRQAREDAELNDLLDVMEMHKNKGETYAPSKDGFVFSESQIDSASRRRNRERLIEEAYEYAAA